MAAVSRIVLIGILTYRRSYRCMMGSETTAACSMRPHSAEVKTLFALSWLSNSTQINGTVHPWLHPARWGVIYSALRWQCQGVTTLPGGIEAVIGAHGVVAEELPSVGAVRSGI